MQTFIARKLTFIGIPMVPDKVKSKLQNSYYKLEFEYINIFNSRTNLL